MRLAILIFLLYGGVVAQDYPMEIELVPPPPESGLTFTVMPSQRVAPEWKPPPRPCLICDEIKIETSCRCDDPLTQSLADVLLKEIREAVSSATHHRIRLSKPVSIRAVSSRKLRQMGGESLLGLYEDGVIWVSHDLNRRQATSVIAHELGHAWFFQNRPDVNVPTELLFEGFAEWVSFLALKEMGDFESAARIERVDQSVYGRGARKLIAQHRRDGLDSVLEVILKGRSL